MNMNQARSLLYEALVHIEGDSEMSKVIDPIKIQEYMETNGLIPDQFGDQNDLTVEACNLVIKELN